MFGFAIQHAESTNKQRKKQKSTTTAEMNEWSKKKNCCHGNAENAYCKSIYFRAGTSIRNISSATRLKPFIIETTCFRYFVHCWMPSCVLCVIGPLPSHFFFKWMPRAERLRCHYGVYTFSQFSYLCSLPRKNRKKKRHRQWVSLPRPDRVFW